MNNPLKPNSVGDYLGALFLIIIFFSGIIIFWRTAVVPQTPKPPVEVKEIVLKAPECPLNFEEYQKLADTGKTVKLVSDLNSYGVNGKFINSKNVILQRSGTSEVGCGYLYVRAKVAGKPLNDIYDSIFINPQDFGGHILRSRGLTKSDNGTEVLLPLNLISYQPKSPYNPQTQHFRIADWVKLINVGGNLNFNIALSTLNKQGVIEEVSIGYKCWNPSTGKEENTCQLGVAN